MTGRPLCSRFRLLGCGGSEVGVGGGPWLRLGCESERERLDVGRDGGGAWGPCPGVELRSCGGGPRGEGALPCVWVSCPELTPLGPGVGGPVARCCASTVLIAARLRLAVLGDFGVKIRLAAIGYGWTACGDPRSADVGGLAGDVVEGMAWCVDRGVVWPGAW